MIFAYLDGARDGVLAFGKTVLQGERFDETVAPALVPAIAACVTAKSLHEFCPACTNQNASQLRQSGCVTWRHA